MFDLVNVTVKIYPIIVTATNGLQDETPRLTFHFRSHVVALVYTSVCMEAACEASAFSRKL